MYFLKSDYAAPLIILVGRGLVGDSVYRKFIQSGYFESSKLSVDWSKLSIVLEQDLKCILDKELPALIGNDEVVIVWAAGAAGFNANQKQTEAEYEFFSKLISVLIENISNKIESIIRVFLLSSIGGLYEGQVLVSNNSVPMPKRPYGELKLKQEKYLTSLENVQVQIFRLTSVYGYINPQHRMGLIQTMMQNGINRSVTAIFGSPFTLRDYVWVEDIANMIYWASQNGGINLEVFHLASGNAVSIESIKAKVEYVLRRRLFLSYMFDQTNALNICCKGDTYDGLWRATNIEHNLIRMKSKVMSM